MSALRGLLSDFFVPPLDIIFGSSTYSLIPQHELIIHMDKIQISFCELRGKKNWVNQTVLMLNHTN